MNQGNNTVHAAGNGNHYMHSPDDSNRVLVTRCGTHCSLRGDTIEQADSENNFSWFSKWRFSVPRFNQMDRIESPTVDIRDI